MDPFIRNVLLFGGVFFCLVFGGMTIYVAADTGFDIFTLTAFLIVGMVMLGLIGAIRNPPDE